MPLKRLSTLPLMIELKELVISVENLRAEDLKTKEERLVAETICSEFRSALTR